VAIGFAWNNCRAGYSEGNFESNCPANFENTGDIWLKLMNKGVEADRELERQ
jgi:hypothetical protein